MDLTSPIQGDPRSSARALYCPLLRPLATPPPRLTAAYTVSSPPIPINYTSSPTSPPSLASPSSSALALAPVTESMLASDLPRTTSPLRRCSTYQRGRQACTMVLVARRDGSTGGGRWPHLCPCEYVPLCTGELKKPRVLIINKDVRKCLAPKNGNEILIWIWNNPGKEILYVWGSFGGGPIRSLNPTPFCTFQRVAMVPTANSVSYFGHLTRWRSVYLFVRLSTVIRIL